MKCPYNDFECDWPIATGDIECSECVHYKKEIKSTSIIDQLLELLNKLFAKKSKKQV